MPSQRTLAENSSNNGEAPPDTDPGAAFIGGDMKVVLPPERVDDRAVMEEGTTYRDYLKMTARPRGGSKISTMFSDGRTVSMETGEFIARWGWLPATVWRIDKDPRLDRVIGDDEESRGVRHGLPLYDRRHNVIKGGHPFSEFNAALAHRLVSFWSEPGDKIVDPFSGRKTRLTIATRLGRNYEAYEISPATYKSLVAAGKQTALHSDGFGKAVVHNADGCEMAHTANGSADLVLTCPPYWDTEQYESVPGQLSDCKTYAEFMARMQRCANRCFEVLKAGKFAIFVVADMRRDRELIPYGADTVQSFIKAGFKVHDIIINVLYTRALAYQLSMCERVRHMVKNHEYILVFKKPGDDK